MSLTEAVFGDLVTRYGSPLYVYRTDRVHEALNDLRAALPTPSRIYFSLKANPHPQLGRELADRGCGAELSSVGELRSAMEAGFIATKCLYTGPAKSSDEIGAALESGIRKFSVESVTDLRRVGAEADRRGTIAQCLVRVNGRTQQASGLRMSGDSQFGVDLPTLWADHRHFLEVAGTEIVGAHFFPVSSARDEDTLIQEFRTSIELAARLRDELGLPLAVVDLGGGFTAPFAAAGERPHYGRLRTVLEQELDQHLPGWRGGAPEIAFESGRYLVADCGTLVCRVMEKKHLADRWYVLLDTGVHHLGGMSGLGRLLRPAATPLHIAGRPQDSQSPATIVGPLCTPADVLGRGVPVGPTEAGDVLVFPNVGAYGLTASLLSFLSRPTPVEVVLRADVVVSVSRLEIIRKAIPQPAPSAEPSTIHLEDAWSPTT